MRPSAAICQRVTGPATEPITLAEAKEHLRIDGTDRDAYIAALITVVRERLEEETRRAFITQQWTAWITGDFGIMSGVELPRPRLIADDFLLEYRNTNQTWIPASSYGVLAGREPAQLWLTAIPSAVDAPAHANDAVWRVTYWAGYGEAGADVPGPIKAAMQLLLAHLHERPEILVSGSTIEMPKSMDWLLDSYRVPWEGAIK